MFFKGQTKKIRKTCFVIGGVSFLLIILLSTSYNPVLNNNVHTSTNVFHNSNTNFKIMKSKQTNMVSNNIKSVKNSYSNAVTATSLSYTFNEPFYLQQQNNGAPQVWSSTSIHADNGFLTVGGDGMTFFGNNSFINPLSTGIGYFTGSAWDGKVFLVVGQKYHPMDGVLMGLYNPGNNSLNLMSNSFSPILSTNATLYQTAWNGSNFIILGARLTANPINLMLYSFNPVSGALVNITNTLAPSFASWNLISSVQMLHTPDGIFILIRGQSNVTGIIGEMLGLFENNTFTDLTNYIPSANSVGIVTDGTTPVQNTMSWVNNTLYIANSLANNTIFLFGYNPYTNAITSYYNQFNGITAFVGSLTYLDGYFYISGYNVSNSYPLMFAFNINGSLINVLSSLYAPSLNQSSNWIISSATDGSNMIYFSYGSYPNVYFGIITVSGQPTENLYNIVFNASGLRYNDNLEISVGGTTQYMNSYLINKSIFFTEPSGDYFYTIALPYYYSTVNSTSGWIYVNNTNIVMNELFVINLSLAPTDIFFVETGLPSFASWSIILNGVTNYGQGNTIEFTEIPGTYSYRIMPYTGYTDNPSSGTVSVSGQASDYVQITFTPTQTTTSSIKTISTSPGFELLSMVLGFVAIFYIKRRKLV